MRRPSFRFTVRRLMISAAMVGVAFWIFLDVSRFLRNPYYNDPRYLKAMRTKNDRLGKAEEHARKAALSFGRRAEFHAAMATKWREAAHGGYVPPDPPEPD